MILCAYTLGKNIFAVTIEKPEKGLIYQNASTTYIHIHIIYYLHLVIHSRVIIEFKIYDREHNKIDASADYIFYMG